MVNVSVIIPMYNVESYIKSAVQCVLDQTYSDYEILLVNDGSTDDTLETSLEFDDPRIHIITQPNRGLAGARNTGIRNAKGRFLAFLDADDLWTPNKLAEHVKHLGQDAELGISYSQSHLMDDDGKSMGLTQRPKLTNISASDVICRNPVGNGSAPVIRREVFEDIRFVANLHGKDEDFYFDESFRQSEDIECWTRMAITTDWKFEGIGQPLTWYRINEGGLSANLDAQYENWNRTIEKARGYAPEFINQWGNRARAYQLRYLARRAIRSRNAPVASKMIHRALRTDHTILFKEPSRTLVTLGCSWLLSVLPNKLYQRIEALFIGTAGVVNNPSNNQT